MTHDTRRTHQILDQLRVRNEGLRVCVYGVSAVLNLSQRFKVAQQNIAEPLGIHAWDLPLLCLFILEPNRSKRDDTRQKSDSAQADMVKNQRISLRVKKKCTFMVENYVLRCLCEQPSLKTKSSIGFEIAVKLFFV